MRKHLSYDEIARAVKSSPQSLEIGTFKHFKECEKCQEEYKIQLSADKLLKNIHPKPAPLTLLENVVNKLERISPLKIKEKTDWVFLISMILLFSTVSWFVFSGRISSVISHYTQEIIPEKQQLKETQIIKKIKEDVSTIDFKIEFPDFNFGNIYLAIGILAILFYMIIDRKISKNFKVHKT
jgi:hypothetical protein